MVSDDTEHTCLVAHALARAEGDAAQFERLFAAYLRRWLACLPAGVGFGTLRAILKLWVGFSPSRSGVASAGNGPAMRAAIVGAYAASDASLRARLTRVSTRLTHVDRRAEHGALAVANAAALSALGAVEPALELIRQVRESLPEGELANLLRLAERHAGEPAEVLADALGLQGGVTGFVNHTVPIAVHVWSRHPRDIESGLQEVIRLGGDTDTTGAIVGGTIAAGSGPQGIPQVWLDGIIEWPRSVGWMRELAQALADEVPPPPLHWAATFFRNCLFTLGVYGLVLRRTLPPY